jgi:hypothetical protein
MNQDPRDSKWNASPGHIRLLAHFLLPQSLESVTMQAEYWGDLLGLDQPGKGRVAHLTNSLLHKLLLDRTR